MVKVNQLLSQQNNLSLCEYFNLINQFYDINEIKLINELINFISPYNKNFNNITTDTIDIITQVRNTHKKGITLGIENFLQQYSLNTEEGIILMCLAEALLRVPDANTANDLIEAKFANANWAPYLKQSESMLVNASTWGLMLTGKIVALDKNIDGTPSNLFNRLANKLGEKVIRKAIYAAMKIMGKQFVLGQDIKQAIKNGRMERDKNNCHSFDMLGESAITQTDADTYFNAYLTAIKNLGNTDFHGAPRPSISIKLSALHPRYDAANESRVMTQLYQTCLTLIGCARQHNIAITIDAEEQDKLALSLSLFNKLYQSDEVKGWGKLGIVVQAYSKRALAVIGWLNQLSANQQDIIPLRLVKGAYWDSEIKWAQVNGEPNYPVFTRKVSTDISYLACAQLLLGETNLGYLFPQFASHNAQTICAIKAMSPHGQYEFQRLHGMGQDLFDVLKPQCTEQTIRIYAPVGSHKDLLPYLVRRLLENGANNSFVHKLVDPKFDINELAQHPLSLMQTLIAENKDINNPDIPLPQDIFIKASSIQDQRKNSAGINLTHQPQRQQLLDAIHQFNTHKWRAGPLISGLSYSDYHADNIHRIYSPYDIQSQVGSLIYTNDNAIEKAFDNAKNACHYWQNKKVSERAQCLNKVADLLEKHRDELIALCIKEAGKTLKDSVDEIREAVDFCRYYAIEAQKLMANPLSLHGPTGETNELHLQARGIFVCISPWNFPLAIFLGQVSAALVTGNCVIAKPAEQTSIIAHRTCELMYEAGIPKEVLQLLPGLGNDIGRKLIADERISGVCFTGSTQTAKSINQQLANRKGAIIPFIAETGGQNAMIVDSTALPEQVIKDVIDSAFLSAGQRCSALRVLYVQDSIADKIILLLKGAMAELSVGNPQKYQTDIGPVIDANAKNNLQHHIDSISQMGTVIAQSLINENDNKGHFIAPFAIEIESINQLTQEHFGPILHLIRYDPKKLNDVISDINGTGFGLTLGLHSRNEAWINNIVQKMHVGNIYINRNQIGAVVGLQPFGGQGLSGTGPKAGGPHYLLRFITEKTVTNNITAIGGNAHLLSLQS